MRRMFLMTMGVLEAVAAVVLGGFAWQLPTGDEVRDTIGAVEGLSHETGEQVRGLKEQFVRVRARQPRARRLAADLKARITGASDALRAQERAHDDAVRKVGAGVGRTAEAVGSLAVAVAPEGADELEAVLRVAADVVEGRVSPVAEAAGRRLARVAGRLRDDAARLRSEVRRRAPLDLVVGEALRDGLGDLDGGLRAVQGLLDEGRVEEIAGRAEALGRGLAEAADRLEALAGITNPLSAFGGGKPQPLWPEGKALAAALRAAGRGAAEAAPVIRGLTAGLPEARDWVEGGREVAARGRAALGGYLDARRAATPALEALALGVSRLADEVLALGDSLAAVLADAAALRATPGRLRQAADGVRTAARRLAALSAALGAGADLLRHTQGQLDGFLDQRGDFKTGVRQTLDLLDAFADALPALPEALDDRLEQQEGSLDRLGESIDRVTAVFPEVARGAARTIRLGRLLLLLASALVLLHGGYLIYTGRAAPHADAARP